MPPVKSQREKDREKREAKLADIAEQVKEGTLVVRQMTPEERAEADKRPKREPRKPRR